MLVLANLSHACEPTFYCAECRTVNLGYHDQVGAYHLTAVGFQGWPARLAKPALPSNGRSAIVRAAALPLVEGYINRRVPSDQRATILSLNHMAFALLVAAPNRRVREMKTTPPRA